MVIRAHGAKVLASAGKKIAFVERYLPGGTCTNYGCNAQILLDSPFGLIDGLERYKGLCIDSVPSVDWKPLMQYKKDTLKAYPPALEEMYKAMGADLFKAEGRLADAHTVSAGDKKITGEYIVIGAGEREKRQDIPGRNIFTTARTC